MDNPRAVVITPGDIANRDAVLDTRKWQELVVKSGETRDAEIQKACDDYQAVVDDWSRHYAEAMQAIAAGGVEADPQIAALIAAKRFTEAADLKAGKVLTEALAVRDAAVRAAERDHSPRIMREDAPILDPAAVARARRGRL